MTTRDVAAVVLAAGAGSRFGGGKLLASLEGRPVLQHVLDRLADAGWTTSSSCSVTTPTAIEEAIDWRRERRVRNPDPGRGLSSSVRIGIEALDEGVDGALIVLGDQPLVSVETIRALLDAPPDGGAAHRRAGLCRGRRAQPGARRPRRVRRSSARRPATAGSGR